MRYLLTIYGDQSTWGSLPEENAAAELKAFATFERETAEAGALVTNGALQPGSDTLTVHERVPRQSEGGSAGPDRQMGCFYLLECRDQAQVAEWAAKIPLVGDGGFDTIEIRQVMS